MSDKKRKFDIDLSLLSNAIAFTVLFFSMFKSNKKVSKFIFAIASLCSLIGLSAAASKQDSTRKTLEKIQNGLKNDIPKKINAVKKTASLKKPAVSQENKKPVSDSDIEKMTEEELENASPLFDAKSELSMEIDSLKNIASLEETVNDSCFKDEDILGDIDISEEDLSGIEKELKKFDF